jgi:hypothetical protein
MYCRTCKHVTCTYPGMQLRLNAPWLCMCTGMCVCVYVCNHISLIARTYAHRTHRNWRTVCPRRYRSYVRGSGIVVALYALHTPRIVCTACTIITISTACRFAPTACAPFRHACIVPCTCIPYERSGCVVYKIILLVRTQHNAIVRGYVRMYVCNS